MLEIERREERTIFEQMFINCYPDIIKDNQSLVEEVASYIKENCHKQLTLKKLAEYAGKTPEQLSYLFKRHLDIRPVDYVIQCRLEKAVKLLQYEEYSVQEVAKEVGYADPLYFSRLFKKHLGCAPSSIKR